MELLLPEMVQFCVHQSTGNMLSGRLDSQIYEGLDPDPDQLSHYGHHYLQQILTLTFPDLFQ